jgi:glutamyl-Q tRNA(Asp) synthetase
MARSHGGQWLVRMEDIDTPRVVPGAADDILRTLEAFGMIWDGPVIYQSQRTQRYQYALQRLLDEGLAYPCTCSRRQVAQLAASHSANGVYPGRCRYRVQQPGRPEAIRLRTDKHIVDFQDTLQGNYRQCLETAVGDFVIRRSDGLFAYQLAVVVDDAEQAITQVVRGSDLLDSTPRQIYLQRLLGVATPRYSHLPVATHKDGSKLSKQTHALPLDKRHPQPAIMAALRFLQQNPPPYLFHENLETIWKWAIEHWQPAQIPAVSSIPCKSSTKTGLFY